jgi:glycosyltransferase involved in cell wall biosynthesis
MDYHIELFLIGDRNFEQLLPLIKNLRIQNVVRCFAHMTSYQLAPILQSMDVFVIPSYQEGLCIAALEAMACGVPVISTRCGGPEDYVIPQKTGAIVDSTPAALVTAILEICRNRSVRDSLSQASSKWIIANASEATSREIFCKHLNNLVNKSLGLGNHDRVFYESSA